MSTAALSQRYYYLIILLLRVATRVLGRILKVGVQILKQGVQVQWTTISDISVGRVCHVAGQFCAVAI